MPLPKQPIPINFQMGQDTKTDPWQLMLGQFLRLVNMVFTVGKRLTKRFGFGYLTQLPEALEPVDFTTFQGGLVSIGNSAQGGTFDILSTATEVFANPIQGASNYQPLGLSIQTLIRSNANQIQCDTAVSSNGLKCVAWTEVFNTPNSLTNSIYYKYAVFDSSGNNLIGPTALAGTSGTVAGSPRAFVLGGNFVIVFPVVIAAVYHLQYITVSLANPGASGTSSTIDITNTLSSNLAWDGVVANSTLYLAWDSSAAAGIKMISINSAFVTSAVSNPDPAHSATLVSVNADIFTPTAPIIWANYYSSGTSNGYALAVDGLLNPILAATSTITATTVLALTASSYNASSVVYFEVSNNYGYDAAIPSHYIATNTITQGGSTGTLTTFIRGMGLGSKAFLINGKSFVMATYQSPLQSTDFILGYTGPLIVGKLAYSKSSGYLSTDDTLGLAQGLPSALVNGSIVSIAYLLVETITLQTTTFSASQSGINLSQWDFDQKPTHVEIADALHISGGQLWMYDGLNLVEHGFHLFPDSVEATYYASSTITGDTTNGSKVINNVSSIAKIGLGVALSGTGIPPGAAVDSFTSTTITMSLPASATNAGVTITLSGSVAAKPDGLTNTNAYFVQVLYEWMDNQGLIHRSAPSVPLGVTTTGAGTTGYILVDIPTLRATLKPNVKLVAYRWSVANQVYHQTTSVANPLLNSTSIDYVVFADISSDAQINSNSVIYTEGNAVLENIGAPATNLLAQFDGRLWLVPAETPNLPWFSQQVIPGTPVETSDLLTYFLAPTKAVGGDTGYVTAISEMDEKFVFFRSNGSILYTNGIGPSANGQNSQYSQPIAINSTVICTNPVISIFPDGLVFQCDKGIWALRRNLCTDYIGAPMEAFNSQTLLSAQTIPDTTQVRFVMSGGTILMYDYYFSQWGIFQGPRARLSTLFQGLQTYVDSAGRIFQETPGTYLDGGNAVVMGFTTAWINPAGLEGYQRAYWLNFLGQYLSPHKLQVNLSYDYRANPLQSPMINPDNYASPYGSDPLNGDSYTFGGTGGPSVGDIEQWRIFFTLQKCQSFQVTVQEIFDPSLGTAAGPGLNMSGLNLVVGMKKGYPVLRPALTVS